MSKRLTFKGAWPQIAGVDAHLARTGERAPSKWCDTPADMLEHGGYAAVSRDGRKVIGPFCWFENAERAAGPLCGVVCRWRDRETVVEILRERHAAAVAHRRKAA